jgi:hypothetical protein
MANRVLDVLDHERLVPTEAEPGLAGGDTAVARSGRIAALRNNAEWVREHAVPWVVRRVKGTSSGDGLSPRYPELTRL